MDVRKPLEWVGTSKEDLLEFPLEVKKMIGHSLHLAQTGEDDLDSKPLKGFGSANVREIIKNSHEGTYRSVYTVKFKEFIYVLHVFKKKSKTGIETPKQEINLIKNRLKEAEYLHKSKIKDES
jgi:phage-related protein